MAPRQPKLAIKDTGLKKGGSSSSKDENSQLKLHQMAGPFRNLMKYRASDQCKKASVVRTLCEQAVAHLQGRDTTCYRTTDDGEAEDMGVHCELVE